ncbi:RIP metalloprotease RseP [Pelistega sp. MC2]|uniref:RIP metalloprotease RseP n=1 Tax=Pelistega sp. MC2 TaxID=1720297 RepID=UPI0021087390|nr:RIP metalloprotease RseP [Pelistega sp. MC2]
MFSLLMFIITISVVVVFHEFGHYFAARFYHVYVERFSLGFGKVLFKKKDKKGTEWVISMLPLGGYVKPLAEPRIPNNPIGESIAEKSAFQKIVIYAAGPFFSFLLGIILYTGVFMVGENQPEAILANPQQSTIAYQGGIREGDKIVAVNGQAIKSWVEAVDELIGPFTLGQVVELTINTKQDTIKTITLHPTAFKGNLEEVNWLKEQGLMLLSPPPTIQRIIPDGPAEKAGLKQGDKIIGIDGQYQLGINEVIGKIQQSPNQTLNLLVNRNGTEISMAITPVAVESDNPQVNDGGVKGRINAEFRADFPLVKVAYSPIEAFTKAMNKTWDTAWFSLKMMFKMLTGQASLKNISGPLTIADYSGKVAENGLLNFIQFIALISISIGVLNLLPIPALDGGQMLINFVELVRGKPLSDAVLEGLMRIGYGFLLMLMIFAFTNDILRIFT